LALLLHIETSTTVCSVALSKNGLLIDSIEYDNGYSHAENLHPFIERILQKNNIQIQELNAVSVSKGPGSYTGLRIGASAAKGLAYALNLPLIGVDTLQIMAVAAAEKMSQADFFCPMIDARRMEVYTNVYDKHLVEQKRTEALIITESSIESYKKYSNICFFGNGYLKAKAILKLIPNASFIESIVPSARNMIHISYHNFLNKSFENTTYFEPFYLKEFLILKKQES
jgi:tRNA threonylcarbamoyladenosine biosynthesis protein TsaB